MNPILQQLNRNAASPQIQQIKSMMRMFNSNPRSMVENLIKSNPQYGAVMELVQENGGDPKKAFYALARQKGLDPDEIAKELEK